MVTLVVRNYIIPGCYARQGRLSSAPSLKFALHPIGSYNNLWDFGKFFSKIDVGSRYQVKKVLP